MKKIFTLLALAMISVGMWAASITAADVDFGTVSIKGQSLPVVNSQTVTVNFSGLATEGYSINAEVTEGLLDDETNPNGFYVTPSYQYQGYGVGSGSMQFTVYYSVKAAGKYNGKLVFTGYDTNYDKVYGNVNITITVTNEAEVAKTTPFVRVDKVSDLAVGDVVIFVNEDAKALNGAWNSTYLEAVTEDVKIADGKADVPETALMFTLAKSSTYWQFNSTGGLLGADGNSLKIGSGTTLWSIDITSGTAEIVPKESSSWIQYNSDAPRFKLYSNAQADIQLYKKAGEAQEVEATLAINPTTINFGDVARSATKAIEIAYTAEHLTDDIVWGIEGTDAALFDVADSGNRTSGTVTITYKGTATKSGSVNAQLAYLTQDAKMDAMEGSFPININLLALNGISFKESSYAVLKGENKDLSGEVVFDPADVTNKGLTWKLEGSSYSASVTDAGVFTATTTGDYVVVATSVLGDNIQAKCTLNVSLPVPASIELGATEHEMNIGDTWTLTAAVKPDGTEKTAQFTSDNTAVATVNKNGLITAVAEGTAVITVSAKDYPAVTNTCTIKVVKRTVESIAFANDEVNLNLGSTLQLNPTVTPAAAALEYTISYVSDNTAVATVDENGKVTSVAVGDAVITATISDKSAEITIHVVAPQMFAKVTDPSELAAKDTIILATIYNENGVIAGPRGTDTNGKKKLSVITEGATVTATEAYADNACRMVLGTEKNQNGFTLTIVGASKPIAVASDGNDIVDANTTNCKFWEFVADGSNGYFVRNLGNTNAMFKYHAGNAAIKPYKSNTAGAVYVYAYVRKYVEPDPTDIEDVQGDKVQCTKVLRDGRVFIIRNGETYSITGAKVE